MNHNLDNLKARLIVSCQALPNEPLHSSFIMGRMARAAKEGGGAGIRANTKEDIAEIINSVDNRLIIYSIPFLTGVDMSVEQFGHTL